MSALGMRKAALFLSAVGKADRESLLAEFPNSIRHGLRKMISDIPGSAHIEESIVTELLGDELLGLTAETSHSIDQLMKLAEIISSEWLARVFVANSSMDNRFLLALLDQQNARNVGMYLRDIKELPPQLKSTLLLESSAMINAEAGTAL